jgi:hypothetical protein
MFVMLGSDPHHLGSRFEGVEAGGLGGKLTHKYFMLQGLSQITDGSRVKHRWFFESPLIEPSIELLTPFHQLAPNLL